MKQENYSNSDKVQVIWKQADENNQESQTQEQKQIRVAAYCRVSTELDEQTNSFKLQEQYYTRFINKNPNWRLAGIYSDQGITGTARNKRTGFQRMIRHCEEGKIDKILCKSISRFARNTTDLLDTVRNLKELGIGVTFEKEDIDTLSVQSEFVLSTIAAIAQEESRSISENLMWSLEKRFKKGIPNFYRILGYNIEKDGKERIITINAEEANIVREIYELALKDVRYTAIVRIMIEKGYKTAQGKSEWSSSTVSAILKNERYTGDALCQKTYTTDYLTHKKKINNGERKQYLIENHHPAIISHELFNEVQDIITKKTSNKNVDSNKKTRKLNPLSKRVKCGVCGANYKYVKYVIPSWRCSRSMKSEILCNEKAVTESTLNKVLLKAFELRYNLKDENIIYKLKKELQRIQDNDNIERSRVILKRKLAGVLRIELNITDEEQKAVTATRMGLEEGLKQQEKFWVLLDEDRVYRKETIEWLDEILRNKKGITIFLKELNTKYIRAWVISITVLSPISFTIKWLDNTETAIEISDNSEKK